jgi:RNA polymerase subunit RPABC4/transcription elongation factor Spt4
MTLDPEIISNLVLVLTGFGGAFLAALWLSLVIWTYRDIKSRARDGLVYILATLMVALLSLPGIVIYLVLRPQFTLEEEYQRSLEEEALLQSVENQALCPGCERRILDDWQVCPNCHTRLRKPCNHCGKLMDLPWNVCPFCGTPELGLRTEGIFDSEKPFNNKMDLIASIEDKQPEVSLPAQGQDNSDGENLTI